LDPAGQIVLVMNGEAISELEQRRVPEIFVQRHPDWGTIKAKWQLTFQRLRRRAFIELCEQQSGNYEAFAFDARAILGEMAV
jgi:hypothetical protein